jgi:hypothetical protein
MSMNELASMLRHIDRSAFRLETLNRYAAPGEQGLWQAFRAGKPLPPRTPEADPWLQMVADSVQSGRSWSRVHVLDRPLTEYLQFELLGYHGNTLAGEQVWIADRGQHPAALDGLRQDFWLLDEQIALVMRYNTSGTLVRMDRTDDPAPFLAWRDQAVAHAMPLGEFLDSARDELPRSW